MDDEPHVDFNDPKIMKPIHELIAACGSDPTSFDAELITQMIHTSLKFLKDHETGQLKLVSRALKEMRYAYRIFNDYGKARCVSIFGSARTPEDHPDYTAARDFSQQMANNGWMCITGAADGIMKAGHEIAADCAMGLSIKLPFETPQNSIIAGNPRLITFRYFFTRKLMFLSHSDAVAAFPGGYGTLDELFEVLTLMQTGKTNIIPVVLVEGSQRNYWEQWEQYVFKHLLDNGWISPEDPNFYYIAKNPEDAVHHIRHFYRRYHSSRYVKDDLVIRLTRPLTQKNLEVLNQKYKVLCAEGDIHSAPTYPEETDHVELPRIAFNHTRKKLGVLRAMIDEINNFEDS